MVGHGAKFSRKKEQAIAALLAQPSVAEAARVAGIGHQTLLRWMKNQEFSTRYKAARRAEYRQSMARLRQGATAAAATILKIMFDRRAKAATRLNAATVVLSEAQDAIGMEDFGEQATAMRTWQGKFRKRSDRSRRLSANSQGRNIAWLKDCFHLCGVLILYVNQSA